MVSNVQIQAQETLLSAPSKPRTDSFYSITRNNAWLISRYYSTTNQIDKKLLFNNCIFKFNQADTSTFLIEITGKNSMVGNCTAQDNDRIIFSMPLISSDSAGISTSDSLYNEGSKLLCSWPVQITEVGQSLVKFTMADPIMGSFLIEFTRKEL